MSDLDRERERQRRAFAARAGWGDAPHRPLAGDASARRYERLTRGGTTAVLMDDPPPGHSVGPFVRIARLLRDMGYCAPEIFDLNEVLGFALLEDLGDDTFSARLSGPDASSLERTLYEAATDVLIDLQRRPVPPDLPGYDPAWLMSDAALFLETAIGDAGSTLAAEFETAWREALEKDAGACSALPPRFHAGNLMWLPAQGDGAACVGGRRSGCGFQDARAGPAAYGLVLLPRSAAGPRRWPGGGDGCALPERVARPR